LHVAHCKRLLYYPMLGNVPRKGRDGGSTTAELNTKNLFESQLDKNEEKTAASRDDNI